MSAHETNPRVTLHQDGSATVSGSITGEGWRVQRLPRGWVALHNSGRHLDLTDDEVVDRLELKVFDSRDAAIGWLLDSVDPAIGWLLDSKVTS